MDYSLLVGVERNKRQTINHAMRKRSFLGDDLSKLGNLSRYQDRLDLKSSSLNKSNWAEDLDATEKYDKRSRKAHVIVNETETLHLSIIDYLQDWSRTK